MAKGGTRDGAGRKPKPESLKVKIKTFCIDKDQLDWLNENYGKNSHALVRRLIRAEMEQAQNGL